MHIGSVGMHIGSIGIHVFLIQGKLVVGIIGIAMATKLAMNGGLLNLDFCRKHVSHICHPKHQNLGFSNLPLYHLDYKGCQLPSRG